MTSNQLALENTTVEVISMYENQGVFVDDNGNSIPWKNYTGKLKIGDSKVKFKIEKAYNDDMSDEIAENNLLNI